MSYTVDLVIGGPELPPIPNVVQAVVRAEARVMPVMRAAGNVEAQTIKAAVHDRSGSLDKSVAVSVRRIAGGGVTMKYGAIKKVPVQTRKNGNYSTQSMIAFYGDFVDRGTGIYGPEGRKIQPHKRGLVRMGANVFPPSGDGQKAQRMFTQAAEHFGQATLVMDRVVDGIITDEITNAETRARR